MFTFKIVTLSYCTDENLDFYGMMVDSFLYCTVLYCTVLYCTVHALDMFGVLAYTETEIISESSATSTDTHLKGTFIRNKIIICL